MKTENQVSSGIQPESLPSSVPLGKRRKLIRGGSVVVPVVLALKSTPVLACNCKLPSGFSASGNLSRNGGASCQEPAKGPSYWIANVNSSSEFSGTGGVSINKKFNIVFGGTDTRIFLDVLRIDTFASLVVAAYLDIKADKFKNQYGVPLASETDIKNMWQGIYKPSVSSPAWNSVQSENYLRYVMGL